MPKEYPKEVTHFNHKYKVASKEDEDYLKAVVDFIIGDADPKDMREAILKKGGTAELERIKKIFTILDSILFLK
jgi:hypothetical protein